MEACLLRVGNTPPMEFTRTVQTRAHSKMTRSLRSRQLRFPRDGPHLISLMSKRLGDRGEWRRGRMLESVKQAWTPRSRPGKL